MRAGQSLVSPQTSTLRWPSSCCGETGWARRREQNRAGAEGPRGHAPLPCPRLDDHRGDASKPCRDRNRQEFLRYFLDGLAEDLNRQGGGREAGARDRGSAPAGPCDLSSEALSRLPAEQQADRAWAAHLARNDSEITGIFSGQLESRIRCKACGNVSYCFDPFFDLSVPLAASPPPSASTRAICNAAGSATERGCGRGADGDTERRTAYYPQGPAGETRRLGRVSPPG